MYRKDGKERRVIRGHTGNGDVRVSRKLLAEWSAWRGEGRAIAEGMKILRMEKREFVKLLGIL